MNSFFTKTEIEQQPELWKEVYSLIHSQSNQIKLKLFLLVLDLLFLSEK